MHPEPPELINVSLRLPADVLAALDARARQIDRAAPNRSAVVRQILERAFRISPVPAEMGESARVEVQS